MAWIGTTLFWYGILAMMGVIFAPTARYLFPQSPDRGYPFAKTIGIIVTTYLMFLFGTLHLATFSTMTVYFLLALAAIGNYFLFKKSRAPTTPLSIKLIVIEEILFIAGLLALAFMRGQEPSIHGLEKFMDFGFINSILRSKYFPPLDMWYAPLPINYYYFGHMSGALLIKLTGIPAAQGYNLILATIFAQGLTLAFSLSAMIVSRAHRTMFNKAVSFVRMVVFGALGAVLVNTIGNLHTIYVFSKGYPNESPVPYWKVLPALNHLYNPEKYWYPNATRFIPYTIHEFPSYSYVVADLHGHVFDIPFVLLTLALAYTFFMNIRDYMEAMNHRKPKPTKHAKTHAQRPPVAQWIPANPLGFLPSYILPSSVIFGFMLAVHYMTNAFDGPIYFLLLVAVFFALYNVSVNFLASVILTGVSFVVFALPFSLFFKPFASGIGVNCAPAFLVKMQKLGPFLFEKGNCQISPWWMLLILWGFYLVSMLLFVFIMFKPSSDKKRSPDLLPLIFFMLGFFLILIPEFFYIKDIYPQHYRANTMFKLGYQAFMMMGIASMYVFYRISVLPGKSKYILKGIYLFFFVLVFIYPFYSVPSYYGKLDKVPQLDGAQWIATSLPQDVGIIDYLNTKVSGQPVILEAQGDSYTDYERISAFTGLPTVAGWWVHEWLWRGSADAVGSRIPEVTDLYESVDLDLTKTIIKKYNIKYVVVSGLEREKYKNLQEKKFEQLGQKVYTSENGLGALYQVEFP